MNDSSLAVCFPLSAVERAPFFSRPFIFFSFLQWEEILAKLPAAACFPHGSMPGARVRTRPRYLPPDRSGPCMWGRLRRGAGRGWYWLGARFYRAYWGPLPQAQSGFSPDQFLLQTLSPTACRCSRCLASRRAAY